jgi:hypothetical protein
LNNALSISNDPWPHVVIDDHYDEQLLKNATREMFSLLTSDKNEFVVKSGNNIFISKNNLYTNAKFPITQKLLQSKNVNELLELFPDHRDYTNLRLYGECILCLTSAEHPVHDESEDKVLSSVTYLYPSSGQGTMLYDQKKNFVKQILWKPNRTMVFAGKSGVTWHSYRSTDSIRLTLNTFLMR